MRMGACLLFYADEQHHAGPEATGLQSVSHHAQELLQQRGMPADHQRHKPGHCGERVLLSL